jgi:hypothetical protein
VVTATFFGGGHRHRLGDVPVLALKVTPQTA